MFRLSRILIYRLLPDLLDTHIDSVISAMNWQETNFDAHGWAFSKKEILEYERVMRDLQKEFDFLASVLARR